MKKVLKWLGIGFLGLIVLGVMANMGKQPVPATTNQPQATVKVAEKIAEPVKTEEQKTVEPIELSSGNYESGKDFPEGVYDIVWVKGYGNVSSSNLFGGGINAVLGEIKGIETNQEKEYKNIKLPKGTELKLSSVTVKLIKK
jgi:hypothetical protein